MVIETQHYKIVASDQKIEAYSIGQIPFDLVNEWQRELKQELHKHILGLNAGLGQGLLACYGSIDGKLSNTDTENLLFYNIGSGSFKYICNNYLEFFSLSKHDVQQMLEHAGMKRFSHYYKYQIVQIPEQYHKHDPLVYWNRLPVFSLRGEHKPLDYWSWMHKNTQSIVVIEPYSSIHNYGFGIDIDIESPQTGPMNIYTPMKAMLDGIICAFHYMAKNKNSNELQILADRLNCDTSQLTDQSMAVLGERNFVSLSSRITWNPNDDICEQARIYITYNKPQWTISGNLYVLR